jgi:hypothetical protein
MPTHDWTRVDAGIFHHFHQTWISSLARALNAGNLPPEYYALAGQMDRAPPLDETGEGGVGPVGGLRGARFAYTSEPEQYARKQSRIVVRHNSGDRAVAVLEIVSPGNKGSRNALRLFVKKTLEFLEAGIHLLIIDLFPPGPRDPQGIHAAIWSEIEGGDFQLPRERPLTLVSYCSGLERTAYVDPIAVGEKLREMPLFLEPDRYILTPLEPTYLDAFAAVPKRWRDEL